MNCCATSSTAGRLQGDEREQLAQMTLQHVSMCASVIGQGDAPSSRERVVPDDFNALARCSDLAHVLGPRVAGGGPLQNVNHHGRWNRLRKKA